MDVKDPTASFVKSPRVIAGAVNKLKIPAEISSKSNVRPGWPVRKRLGLKTFPARRPHNKAVKEIVVVVVVVV